MNKWMIEGRSTEVGRKRETPRDGNEVKQKQEN